MLNHFAFRPRRAFPRVFRLLCASRGLSSKAVALRCIGGWALAKFKRSGRTRQATIDLGQLKLCIDTSRAEIIPYLEIWCEHCYDAIPGFAPESPDCVVDVGANIGVFSLYQAIKKQAKRVIAIEPAPNVFPRLVQNITVNRTGCVETINAAVGDECGSVPFLERPMSINCRVARSGESNAVMIPCVTLDSLLSNEPCISLLKVDAEGYETQVLKGATETLKKTKRVVVEACTESDRRGVKDILISEGFVQIAAIGDVLYFQTPCEPEFRVRHAP